MTDALSAQVESHRKISSALTPALVLAGSSIAGGLAGLRFAPSEFQTYCGYLLLGGPLLAGLQIAFFTVFDRNRLHTESHLEKKMLISRLQPQFGDANSVVTIDQTEHLTNNPSAGGGANV